MDLIRQWYNGSREYTTGVQLYILWGTDDALKVFFRSGCTPFREQRLAEELKAMLVEPQSPDVPIPTSAFQLTSNIGSNDPIVEELYRKKSTLHKEKDILRHQLESFDNDAERGAAAHQIIKIRRQITEIWEHERYYRQHGRLPQDEIGVTDPAMLKHRRHMVKTNIRRLRSQLRKEPDNKSYKDSLAKFEREAAELDAKIKKYKHLIDG